MNTCKRQRLGVVKLSGLHSLLLFLQSSEHVSEVQLNRSFTLLPSCFSECLLSDEEWKGTKRSRQWNTEEIRQRNDQQTQCPMVHTCNFFCSMLISEYSCAVAKAAARAFFLWLLALLGTEVVMGMGVCTMLIGEFSGRLSSCNASR